MDKKTKISLICATSLILFGAILFGGVMMTVNFDFSKLSTVKYVTNTHNIGNDFKDISIISNTADITFTPSDTDESVITCYEQTKITHSVNVIDGVLNIKIEDTRKWYEHIGISFETPKITVSIPKGEYGKLTIKSSTGDVNIPDSFKFESIDITESTGHVTNLASASGDINIKTSTGNIIVDKISANNLNLSVTTGKITINDIYCKGDISINVSTGKAELFNAKCKNLASKGSTGNINLENVISENKMEIERDTGHVNFTKCDAGQVDIETDTGNVKGSFLSEKIFFAETDTGSVNVPKTTSGGKCEISTDTGNIKITVE